MAATCHVLVIDDSDDIRELLSLSLGSVGYAVVTTSNGLDALQLLHDGLRPQVILSDLMMPRLGGFEFREEQLRSAELRQIPFVVYSGVTDPERTASHLHADEVLHKPIDRNQLLEVVRRYCGDRPT